MSEKYPYGVGPSGRWLIFCGVPLAIVALLLVSTVHHGVNGLADTVGEKALPYVIFFTPVAIGIVGWMLYEYLPKRLIIPLGILGWIVGLSLLYWYFWFGPAAF
jgi:hypothetical protein